eukprot:TRINITY_DN1164_c0_g1_i1.p1 TRINITY_DN1164_c0_g1~~TRINITY_DN1164_c0_g1_i1.p1  ORF type:complete len:140 (-),score=14.86 TRINITY_DN1164_c0_g1_i1:400-819(-)
MEVEILKSIERYQRQQISWTPIKVLEALQGAGTIIEFWKEEKLQSPVVTAANVQVSCPDKKFVNSGQCQGLCHNKGLHDAILYHETDRFMSGECWCAKDCDFTGQPNSRQYSFGSGMKGSFMMAVTIVFGFWLIQLQMI